MGNRKNTEQFILTLEGLAGIDMDLLELSDLTEGMEDSAGVFLRTCTRSGTELSSDPTLCVSRSSSELRNCDCSIWKE